MRRLSSRVFHSAKCQRDIQRMTCAVFKDGTGDDPSIIVDATRKWKAHRRWTLTNIGMSKSFYIESIDALRANVSSLMFCLHPLSPSEGVRQ